MLVLLASGGRHLYKNFMSHDFETRSKIIKIDAVVGHVPARHAGLTLKTIKELNAKMDIFLRKRGHVSGKWNSFKYTKNDTYE